jgi:two-component system, OmpR family, sensor histidine kinase QseC
MKLRSLRTRALFAIVAIVVPALAGITMLVQAQISNTVNARFDARLPGELRLLELSLRHTGQSDIPEWIATLVDAAPLDGYPGRKSFGIWVDGELVAASKGFPLTTPPSLQGFTDIATAAGKWRTYTEQRPGLHSPDEQNLQIAIAEPLVTRTVLIRQILIETVWPLAIALPLVVLGIYIALARSLAPITQLAREIQGRSAEQLEPLSSDLTATEMLPIVESVNQLMSRVGESLEREKRFTADAAHELRTPLTALKTHAQVALETPDEQLRRKTLHKIVGVVNRTSRLVSQLLTLARLDPQAPRSYASEVNLAAIARRTVAELHPTADRRNQHVRLTTDDKVVVRGEGDALSILMRNIVENAIQYSSEGESIDVRVYRHGKRGVVEVEDRGPGIPDTEKSEVFRRFWRIPGTQGFGTGLGLSIVQRIVELHGGEISLRDGSAGAGLRVNATFPTE